MRSLGRSILCPTDLTPLGDQAVGIAAAVAARGTEMHLLHVCVPHLVLYPSSSSPVGTMLLTGHRKRAAAVQAGTHLADLARSVDGQGIVVHVHVVHDADPASAIVGWAQELKVDAIVLSSGRGPLRRWLVGSVSRSVLRAATVPVLLLQGRAWPTPEATVVT